MSVAKWISILALAFVPAQLRAQTVSLLTLNQYGAKVEADARSARLKIFETTITFDFNSPFFKVGNEVFQLIAPVQKQGGDVMVPKQFVTEWLPSRFPAQFRKTVAPKPAPATSIPTPTPTPNPTAPAQNRVVIVDAGHGGIDSGKVGPTGLAEKTVTLNVATKLAAMLKDRGYEVHMTRDTDTLIALADRPRFANQWKNNRPATLFVSIHANSGASPAQGFETYFLSEARTADERRVAEMENAVEKFEMKKASGPVEQLLTDLKNEWFQRASNDFAEVIQRELAPFHPGPSRGVKQAGFRVLVGAVMPAVLVEIAFISNPDEARLLGTSAFQEKIAYSLARSISNYFDTHESQ
ncbi:MAG TPA: N-acetylmuramoyl-L-alanine amidase [Longimicrobiales bacterium]|nr:N-acetylmuramoyl-L-alanine amidase [Longimicrobiales bacterium]